MSEIKVNSIKGVGASAAAITVNNSDGTCTAKITNNLSNRNLIINGAMQVAQRGTSSTASGLGTVDRFRQSSSSVDASLTQAQVDVSSGTTPYTLGFRKCLKVTNADQTSGATTANRVRTEINLEAQDIANSGWNYTSTSSFITLSFWVKSSVAQNFYGYIQTFDGTGQAYAFETGSLTANTWTKITKTIPGNSNLTFDNNEHIGFQIVISQFMGTDYTGSVSLNQWAAYSGSARMPDNTSTWYTTNGATFEQTGFQLEVSSVATDFEHLSFADELRRCQRYYYQNTSVIAGIFIPDSADTDSAYGRGAFPVTMRATPTVVLGDNAGNNDGKVTQHGVDHNIAATASDMDNTGFTKIAKTSGNWNTGSAKPIAAKIASATAEL